jgi:hypothetical protein
VIELKDLHAPPAHPEFREELWRRIETGERLARGRRRAAALVAVVAALVIAGAAGVSAFRSQTRPLDRAVTCPVPDQGGVNRLDVIARAKAPTVTYNGHPFPSPAQALLQTGTLSAQTQYVGVTSAHNGYLFNSDTCQPAAPAAVPLSHATLKTVDVVKGTHGQQVDKECWLAATVRIRMHVTFSGSGAPTAAQIVLRSGPNLRPAAYIDWTPTRITVYTAPSCNRG